MCLERNPARPTQRCKIKRVAHAPSAPCPLRGELENYQRQLVRFRENRPAVDPAGRSRNQRPAKLLLELVELTGIEPVTS
jgi:hypothetical protein